MGRGLSTVLDVAVACLLLTASVAVLVSAPATPTTPPPGDRVARAVLTTTLPADANRATETGDRHRVETSVADHLYAAARRGALSTPLRTRIEARIAAVDRRTSLAVAAPALETPLVVGTPPPPDAAVDATTITLAPATDGAPGRPDSGRVSVTVRTWSR